MKDAEITKFERGFLYVLFFELFAGGSGRIIAFGPLSIRELLFAALFLMFGLRFILNSETRNEILQYFKHPNSAIFLISLAMVGWIAVSAIVGVLAHHGVGPVATDVIRVIYVVMIVPMIYYMGPTRFTLKDFLRVFYFSALIVAILTVAISVVGKTLDDQQFIHFYRTMNRVLPGNLFFRPSRGVFYKSMFMVMFAMITASVQLMEKEMTKIQVVVLALGAVAVVLSETRGLFLGYLLGLLTYILVKLVIYFAGDRQSLHLTKAANIFRISFLIIASLLTLYFFKNSTINRFSKPDSPRQEQVFDSNKKPQIDDVSMSSRYQLLSDSIKIVKKSAKNLVVGSGYGTKIGDRTTGLEMSFIDILVEQGLVGFLLWLCYGLLPLYYLFKQFLREKRLANSFIGLLGCTLAMLLVTNINPFLNSPIGLGFLIPVIVLTYKLTSEPDQTDRYSWPR